jgi:DNA-binding Lrp family transcriptional regulator
VFHERHRRQPVAGGVTAYVLIQAQVNAARVASDIRALDGVESADDVSGPYDVIVRASARNMDELGQLVVAQIQGVEGITRTLTCPVVEL